MNHERDEVWVGLGVVARDSTGEVLFAMVRRIKAWWQPEVAEAKAIELAVRMGHRFGCENVIIETDCQVAVTRLSKGANYLTDMDSILIWHRAIITTAYSGATSDEKQMK